MKKSIRKCAVRTLSVILTAGMLVGGNAVSAFAYQYNGAEFDDETNLMVPYNPAYDLNGDGMVTPEEYDIALAKIKQATEAAEEAARQAEEARKAAEAEAARQAEEARKAAEAEAARQAEEARKAAEAEAARQAEEARKAAEAEAARQAEEARKAAEAEAARQAEEARKAAEAEAARQAEEARKAAEAEAARKAAEEAARKAAEEAAQPVKRETPNAGKNILNGRGLTNVPENAVIWADGVGTVKVPAGGNYTFANDFYNALWNDVKGSLVTDLHVKAVARNTDELDSDVQTLRVMYEDFPPVPKTKRPVPNARFEASTSVLSNLDCAKISLDGGRTWSSDQVGSITISGVRPDLEILVVNTARTEDEEDSDTQVIWISKADAPVGVAAVPAPTIGGKGSIVNVNTSEEYKASGASNWIAIGGNTVPNLDPGSYDVRVKASGTMLASDPVTVTVTAQQGKKAVKPNALFEGSKLLLYNLTTDCVFSVDGYHWIMMNASSVTLSRDDAEKAVHGDGIRVKRVGDGVTTIDSDIQMIAIAEAVKPSGLETTPATNGNNGTIKNVTSDMQITADNITWYNVGASSVIKGLGAGKYYLRRRGSNLIIPSEAVAVTVAKQDPGPQGKMATPNASFNAYNMTLSDVYGCRFSLDGGYGFSATITDKNEVCINEGDIRIDKGIIVVRTGDKYNKDSDAQKITLSKQALPTGLGAVSATATQGGMITGLNTGMEYKAANSGTWVVANGNTAVNLPVGTYYVRTRGAHTAMPSDCVAIVIQMSSTAVVVQPQPQPVVVKPTQTPAKTDDKKTDTSKKDADKTTDSKDKDADKVADAKDAEAGEDETAETAGEIPADLVAANEPVVIGQPDVAGWDAIEANMTAEPMAVDLSNAQSTVIPSAAFQTAALNGTELILDMSPDMAWSISPNEIKSVGQDIDLGIVETLDGIPSDAIMTIQNEGAVQKQFSIKHEGDFGFTANLTVKLNAQDAGKTAKLFYYNKAAGTMDLVDYAIINNYGEATFEMTHASSYAVSVNTGAAASEDTTSSVTDKSSDSKTNASDSTVKKNGKKNNAWLWIVLVAVFITAAACVLIIYLKKKEEEERARRRKAAANRSVTGAGSSQQAGNGVNRTTSAPSARTGSGNTAGHTGPSDIHRK